MIDGIIIYIKIHESITQLTQKASVNQILNFFEN